MPAYGTGSFATLKMTVQTDEASTNSLDKDLVKFHNLKVLYPFENDEAFIRKKL